MEIIKQKKFLIGLIAVFVLLGSVWGIYKFRSRGTGTSHVESAEGEREIEYWTCGMHPSVHQDHEGKCPICGMDLVPKYKESTQASKASTDDLISDTTKTTVGEAKVQVDFWTCPMHPTVHQEHEGKCPICGMDLVAVQKTVQGDQPMTNVVARIKLPSSTGEQKEALSIKMSRAESMILHKTIQTSGKFDVSEKLQKTVAARIDGRIEELFIDFTGAEVKKGQALLSIYSPELVSTQQEYLQALSSYKRAKTSPFQDTVKNSRSLLDATRDRLLLWGITQWQIDKLAKSKKVETAVTIYSPISGIVIKKNATEGMYFKEGHALYDIADLSIIWLYADIYENDLPLLKKGLEVVAETPAFAQQEIKGKITFIDPVLDSQTRTVKIRAEFSNQEGHLKPQMFATVKISIPTPDKIIAIPKHAILDTGKRKVVYVYNNKQEFLGLSVSTGMEAEGYVQILSGLKEGQLVVHDANFLLDSQSQLMGGQEGLYLNVLEIDSKDEKKGSAPEASTPNADGHRH